MTPSPPLPEELQIEVTGACHLRCKMCLVSYRPTVSRRSGALSFELYEQLLDANPNLKRVTLQGLGEPLLAPRLLDMVRAASARGLDVGFNTNAMLLTPLWSRRLIDAGLSWLRVSLDGATAETHEAIRKHARFPRVVANIAAFVAAKRKAGSTRPRLQLNLVALRRNLDELPALVRLCAESGLDRLWVQNLSHSFDDTDPFGGYAGIREFAADEALWNGGDIDRAREIFAEARAEAVRLGVPLPLTRLTRSAARRRAEAEPGCTWPWTSAYVTHDGDVQPCCMVMGSDQATLGSVGASSFVEVWDGERYREFRERLLSDSPPAVCRGCSAYRGTF